MPRRVYLCGAVDAQVHGGLVLRHTAALVLRLATVALCALGIAACQGCRSSSTPVSSPPAGTDLGPPTLRLYLLTDLAGALEPCGCTKDQLGGIDHLGAWIRQSGAAAPTGLVASAGPLFFMDPALDAERADQDRTKADDDRSGPAHARLRGVRSRHQRLGRWRRRPGKAGDDCRCVRDRACETAGHPVAAVRQRDRPRRRLPQGRIRRVRPARFDAIAARLGRGERREAGRRGRQAPGRQRARRPRLGGARRGQAHRGCDPRPDRRGRRIGPVER